MKRITFLVAIMLLVAFYSCQKEINHPNQQPEDLVNAANASGEHGHLKQTKEFSCTRSGTFDPAQPVFHEVL